MKCAMCKREIRGRDYIRVSNPSKEDLYVHEMPCEWYDFKENKDDDAWLGWDQSREVKNLPAGKCYYIDTK